MRRAIGLAILLVILGTALAGAALTYPVTAYVAWDQNPSTDQVTSYTLSLDGATVSVTDPLSCGGTTSCKQPLSVPNSSPHTACVTATNLWGTSSPSCVTFIAAAPGQSRNLKVTAQ